MGGNRPSQKSVLITGASGGIGKVTAIYLARRGYHVIATSRDIARLDEIVSLARTESLDISPCQLDINDPEAIAEEVPRIISQAGKLDALVNNAGYGLWGCLEDLTIDEVKAQFETNLFAVLGLSKAALPHMRERGAGTIVNVGSVAGRIGSPGGGAYAASKFALEGLSKVMRMEVAQFGIRVVLIEPGLFRTGFRRNQVMGEQVMDPGSPYYGYAQRILRNSEIGQRLAADPIKVSRVIGKAMEARRPKQRYAVGLDARLGVLGEKLLPDGLLEYLVKRVLVR